MMDYLFVIGFFLVLLSIAPIAGIICEDNQTITRIISGIALLAILATILIIMFAAINLYTTYA